VSDILGDLAQGVVADWLQRRRRRRLARRGEFEVALRVVDGVEPGLSGRWTHVIATFEQGLIKHHERGSKAVRPVHVVRVDRSDQRQPRGREAVTSVNPNLRVFRVETGNATLEIGVHHEYVYRVVQSLAGG
jgi:hypothetical protein